MSYSQEFAKFIYELKFENVPVDVVSRAKELMLDTIGVAIAGSTHQNAIKMVEGLISIPGSSGEVRSWAGEGSFSPVYAVLANCACAHVLDFDDTHTTSIVHGSTIFTPLIFALAKDMKIDGKKMIEAFVCGWEVASRVGMSSNGSFHKKGFHTTAIAGSFGAMAVASKLLELNEEQIVNALGICGSLSAGVNEFLSNSSASKIIHVGNMAKSAIIGANLAKANLSGPVSIFEGRDNIFRAFGIENECDKNTLTKTLNHEWEVLNVSIKPYPSCHFAHGFIDCALKLREDEINLDEIESIKCFVDEVPINFICDPLNEKRRPKTEYGAKFSLPFLFSCALVYGEVTLESYTKLDDSKILAFADKISYEKAEPNTTGFPKYFPGNIEVSLKNGKVLKISVKINRGNPENPLSFEEVVGKFKSNTANKISIKERDEIIEKISNLEWQRGEIF